MTRPALQAVQDISAQLRDRVEEVAHRYAPHGYQDGRVWRALNPGRADRNIGSFWINLSGPHAGRWHDASTGTGGDMLDLIGLAVGSERKLDEARAFLGMSEDETPAQRKERERRSAEARQVAAARRRKSEEKAAQARKRALALWMEAQPIKGTPAAAYLTARGVGPADLGREPSALRFHPELWHQAVDPETGEVLEGRLPAMVAAIAGGHVEGRPTPFIGLHRTYLARGDDGIWRKAPVPSPKKVLGAFGGGAIRLWSGFGPRGGKGRRLAEARPGARLYIAEGIEDALSAAVLLGEAQDVYVIAAVSLMNMRDVALPPAIRDVTIIGDQDPGPQAQAALRAAVEAHAHAGRRVRLWQNHHDGKDLNDALMKAREQEQEGAA
ncbi:MAG: toprim domain-containing protein [Pseudomonadota bacterium]